MKPGEIIGRLAQKKGISLRQLAIKADIPYNTLYAIVKRKSERIDLTTLQAIAAALGVPITDLLIGPPPLEEDDDSPAQLPEDVQRVASSMERMNDEGREKVVGYAEDLEASGRYKKRGTAGMGKEA